MLNPSRLVSLTGVLLFLLCTAPVANAAYVDPPGRVARLEHTQGAVSYSPAGEDAWIGVVRNRPLINGDRLWSDRDARAEFQVGSAAVRLGSNTSVEILDLSDRIAQIQLTQGTLNLNVRRIHSGQTYEISTPTLAFAINRAGRYRVDVNPRNAVTTIVVWEGAGEAYGENSTFPLRAGDTVRFYDADLRDYEMYGLPSEDEFDRYCRERDRRLEHSASLRYLDDDVVGYADLDKYGSWRPVRNYGNVWFPSRVDAEWAPYRDGHWVWQEPWGWTWVDDAPWGFAPSHYGRWVNVSNRWGWIPGPRYVRPVYAPALVAFVGGSGWSLSLSLGGETPVGWFPLGPREVYVPSYQASRDYFKRVNVNNTVINNTIITNVYNNYSSGTININKVNYANRTVAGAVTAVPRTVFVNAQPVGKSALRVDRRAGTTGEITRVAPIAPSVRSVIGSGKAVEARPSHETIDRPVVVRNAPPPVERSFAAREQQLQKNPGLAPAPIAVKSVQNGDDKIARKVRVIGEQHGAVDARAAGSRRAGDNRGTPSAAPGKLRPLDRSVEPATESKPVTDGRLDKALKGQSDAQQQTQRQQKAAEQQQAERQHKADNEQKAAEQQKVERQRQVDTQKQEQRQQKAVSEQKAVEEQKAERQRQAESQQQEQRQRKAVSEQKAVEEQKAERQRQVESQQQEQRQRKADNEQKAAEQQKVERQRQVETQQQEQRQQKAASEQKAAEQQKVERQRQAESQQQEQRQRKADNEQKAAEQQKVERQRQAETQQQEQRQQKAASEQKAAEQQQAERQRKADIEQQAAKQQQAERQRQVEAQQQTQRQQKAASEQKAAEQQQAERQRKADIEQQAAKQQQAERQRQVDTQQQAAEQQKAERQRQVDTKQQEQRQPKDAKRKQTERQRQAECERLAIEQHKDVNQCQTETQPK